MESAAEHKVTIPEFFRGTNVLVTGATGFMGKVLVEKLLRSCPDVENIYIIARSKEDLKATSRLQEIVNVPVSSLNCSLSL